MIVKQTSADLQQSLFKKNNTRRSPYVNVSHQFSYSGGVSSRIFGTKIVKQHKFSSVNSTAFNNHPQKSKKQKENPSKQKEKKNTSSSWHTIQGGHVGRKCRQAVLTTEMGAIRMISKLLKSESLSLCSASFSHL